LLLWRECDLDMIAVWIANVDLTQTEIRDNRDTILDSVRPELVKKLWQSLGPEREVLNPGFAAGGRHRCLNKVNGRALATIEP